MLSGRRAERGNHVSAGTKTRENVVQSGARRKLSQAAELRGGVEAREAGGEAREGQITGLT